ncbi:MAG: phosphoribosylglycinamide formyltransferase-1 [Sulfurimonas sp.]|jgi:phosphoribosylglycinamide formyltransferase-1|uniref:phosphoribosylglycinamide formyltransferase n=1 Tax=Sulfurimonas sp. TaxID=2022749 RepID=UPI0039E48B6B
MINIAVLASHNGSGLDTLLKACEDKILNLNIKLVITNNTNAPVLEKAKAYNIQSFLVNSKTNSHPDDTIHQILQENNCQYVILAGYMKKISIKITNDFKVINTHPALLPKYGGEGMYGRFVHEAVINNNEVISGVTIHEVNEEYDEGKIILQKELTLISGETSETLEGKIKALEKIALVEALAKCLK